jgi:hypothetical protein
VDNLIFAVEGGALQPKTCQKAQQNQFCMALASGIHVSFVVVHIIIIKTKKQSVLLQQNGCKK